MAAKWSAASAATNQWGRQGRGDGVGRVEHRAKVKRNLPIGFPNWQRCADSVVLLAKIGMTSSLQS